MGFARSTKTMGRPGCALMCAVIALSTTSGRALAQDGAALAEDYRIGSADTLDVVVWADEKLSTSVTVRPDGKISIPLLNDVQAAGLTPMQLGQSITQRLAEYVSSPQVTVIVSAVRSFKVSVLGKVRNPGRYDLTGPTTVLDVLAMAGGFEEFSNPDNTYVLRPLAGTYERIPFKYSTAITGAGKSINIRLARGDFIIVP